MAKKQQNIDIDARFLLANERTLLAWIRTALALEAGGLALAALHHSDSGNIFGVCVILFGGLMALVGYTRFHAADKAIRSGSLPTTGHWPAIQVIGVALVALVLAIAQLTILN